MIKLLSLIAPAQTAISADNDASSIVKAHARELAADIKRALPNYHDAPSAGHLKDRHERLLNLLDPRRMT